MFGLKLDGVFQRGFDLATQTLCQRLGYADALAVAAQGIGLPVKGIGVLGVLLRLGFSALGDFHVHVESGFFLLFQVGGVNAGRLVGRRDAGATRLQTGLNSLLKLTVVKKGPRFQDLKVFGQGFGIAGVQACPVFLDAGCVELIVADMGEGSPFGHFQSPLL